MKLSTKPQAELHSVVLGWGELPRHAFTVSLEKERSSYGEWRAVWKSDKTTFHVEIISLGFRNRDIIGHPDKSMRYDFSGGTVEEISIAITEMFKDAVTKKEESPFSNSKAIFTGEIRFRPGWINSSLRR